MELEHQIRALLNSRLTQEEWAKRAKILLTLSANEIARLRNLVAQGKNTLNTQNTNNKFG